MHLNLKNYTLLQSNQQYSAWEVLLEPYKVKVIFKWNCIVDYFLDTKMFFLQQIGEIFSCQIGDWILSGGNPRGGLLLIGKRDHRLKTSVGEGRLLATNNICAYFFPPKNHICCKVLWKIMLMSYMRNALRRDIAKENIFVPAVIYRDNVPMY